MNHHTGRPAALPRIVAISLSIGIACAGCACKEGTLAATPGSNPQPTSSSNAAPAIAAANASEATSPPSIQAIVDAQDRSADDRALDNGRHPAELLKFFDLRPGMRVGEISSGGGYTTELLARAVAPGGVVYGQNSKFILERFAEKPWSERLTKPAMKNVVRVDREFDEPFPPEAKELDAVVDVLFYHDTVWQKTDRARMNQSIYNALRKGGAYFIIDHSGRPGTSTSETQALHRIEEKAVREEVLKAGFQLAAEGNFLRNPADARDWNASPRAAADKRGTSDRFVLKFVKP